VTATIRYGVPPDGLGGVGLGALGLQLRYRAGDGQVVATLIEVAVPPGSPGEPTTVTETPLLEFDSTQFDAAQGGFLTHIATTGVDSPDARHVLEFGPNVYYIALSLTGPEFVLGHPPAVSSIEIVGR
jgi:hypothetical protein